MGSSSSKEESPTTEREKVVCDVSGGGVLEIRVPVIRAEIREDEVTIAEYTGVGITKLLGKARLAELERKVKAYPKKDLKTYARRWLGGLPEDTSFKKVDVAIERSGGMLTVVYTIAISEEVAKRSCLVWNATNLIEDVEYELRSAGDVALEHANPVRKNVYFFASFEAEFNWSNKSNNN